MSAQKWQSQAHDAPQKNGIQRLKATLWTKQSYRMRLLLPYVDDNEIVAFLIVDFLRDLEPSYGCFKVRMSEIHLSVVSTNSYLLLTAAGESNQHAELTLWDIETARYVSLGKNSQPGLVACACWSEYLQFMITVTERWLKVWDLMAKSYLYEKRINTFAQACKITRDTKFFILQSHRGLAIWSLESGEKVREFLVKHIGIHFNVDCFTLSKDGETLLAGWDKGAASRKLSILDIHTGEEIHTLDVPTQSGMVCCEFSPNEELILTTHQDQTIHIFKRDVGYMFVLGRPVDYLQTFAQFSFDGKFVVTLFGNDMWKIWSTQNGKCIQTLTDKSTQKSNSIDHVSKNCTYAISIESRENCGWFTIWKLPGKLPLILKGEIE